jgi:hypothetical protein
VETEAKVVSVLVTATNCKKKKGKKKKKDQNSHEVCLPSPVTRKSVVS